MTAKLYATPGNVLLDCEEDEGFSVSFISGCAFFLAHLLAWPYACLMCFFPPIIFVFQSHPRLQAARLCLMSQDLETPDIALFYFTFLLSAHSCWFIPSSSHSLTPLPLGVVPPPLSLESRPHFITLL